MKTKTKTRNALCGLTTGLLLLASGAGAGAQNLIQNGSFESPALSPGASVPSLGSPWVQTTPGDFTATFDATTGTLHNGLIANSVGENVALCGGAPIYQAVSTTAGVPHTLTFLYGKGGDFFRNTGTNAAVYLASNPSVPIAQTGFLFPPATDFGTDRLFPATLTFTPAQGNIIVKFFNSSSRRTFGWLDNVVLTVPNTAPIVGQLPAPTLPCSSSEGAIGTLTILVNDTDGNALTVEWTVDNVLVATHLVPANAGAFNDSLVNHPFGFGTHTVSVAVRDGIAAPVIRTTTVTVAAHDAPVPQLATLPTITDECSASITQAPKANDPCAEGGVVMGVSSLGPLPLNFTEQGTYTVTWTYTSPHDGMLSTTQQQTVIVKDITPPTITCPPDISVAWSTSYPPASTGGSATATDNCDPQPTVSYTDKIIQVICPTVIERTWAAADHALIPNVATCVQIITVNNLFAEDGVLWHQPLARNGASEDTDPSAGNTLKYRFKLGSTIPIKVHAQGCDGDVTANSNVTGKVVVFGDTDMDGVIDANENAMVIDFNGVGEAGGVMDRIDGHLKYNLDTKKLVQTFKCYILQVTITDNNTGESRVETVPIQSK
jgi:hypothetical protein